ncbi:hypothetical protein ACQV5M_19935, partial [Leptospira sp. SA-E8]|uniref:hypothetical protein n=1 Tax=Leptospira sp. SA-E8 TaxID=3422259 RepID=UPI003EBD8800
MLRDALFAAPGGSDLLLPRMDLGALFPQAALRWLQARGTTVQLGQRVDSLDELQGFDAVILACPAPEAARLTRSRHPAWAAQAEALRHTSIATVYARGLQTEPQAQGVRLSE